DGKPGRFDGRDHGPPAQNAAGRGRAVPSRIDTHAAWARHAAKLPSGKSRLKALQQVMPMPIKPQDALQRIIENREIFHDEMVDLMRQVMRGDVSPVLTAAILSGLRVKKETVGEIAGAARVMRE